MKTTITRERAIALILFYSCYVIGAVAGIVTGTLCIAGVTQLCNIIMNGIESSQEFATYCGWLLVSSPITILASICVGHITMALCQIGIYKTFERFAQPFE